MATILSFRTSSYSRDIYLYGNRGFEDIPAEYHEPVKKHAADTFTQEQLDNALDSAYITEQEYNDTMAFRTPAE